MGTLVTFEGGEGSGKSTQIRALAEALRAAHSDLVTTREPGGSPLAEAVRAALLGGAARDLGPTAETILFAAARIDHVARTIRPVLERGGIVLCDRFVDSTRVYQGAVSGVATATIAALERIALDGAAPDLTLILDVPAELGMERATRRRGASGEAADRFESEGLDYHRRIRAAFLAIAAAEPARCAVVDAAAPTDFVSAAIRRIVADRLPALAAAL